MNQFENLHSMLPGDCFSPIVFVNRGESGDDYEIRQLTNKPRENVMPDNEGWCYDANQENQIVIDRQRSSKGQDTYFICYNVDGDENYIVANKATGLVMEHVAETHGSTTYGSWKGSRYTGDGSQIIHAEAAMLIPPRRAGYRFSVYSDGAKKVLDACRNRYDNKRKITSIWERDVEGNKQVLEYPVPSRMETITLPELAEKSSLGPVPKLTGFNNPLPSNNEAKRAIIGSVLIPSILVNDSLTLADRIKKNPYYTLEYREYWHLMWADVFTPGELKSKTEVTGISNGAQEKMKEVVGMSISTDLGLKFTQASDPFKQQIIQGLNTGESYGTDLMEKQTMKVANNHYDTKARFAKYARAYEFVLKDSDGKVVGSPWVAVDENEMSLQDYKE